MLREELAVYHYLDRTGRCRVTGWTATYVIGIGGGRGIHRTIDLRVDGRNGARQSGRDGLPHRELAGRRIIGIR